MWRSRLERASRIGAFALAVCLIPLAAHPAPHPAGAEQGSGPLLYDVTLNGWPLKLVAEFHQDGDRLWMTEAEFAAIGLKVDGAPVAVVGDEHRIYLDKVAGLGWTVDPRAQAIEIKAPFERMVAARTPVSPGPAFVQSRADWGGLITYDAYGEWSLKPDDPYFGRALSSNFEARLFSPRFTAVSDGQLSLDQDAKAKFVRLESYVDFDDPEHWRRLRLGDSFASNTSWTRTFRFGGVQWGTDMSLRPDIVDLPALSLPANISAPSSVDVFSNGVRRYAQALDPGAFQLTDLPVVTGVNRVQVVITDKAGRRVQQTLPLYASTSLLPRGRDEFSFAVGAERRSYAVESNDYGRGFALGQMSHGFTDALTAEGDVAVSPGYVSATAAGSVALFDSFLLFGAVSGSSSSLGRGQAWWLGVERNAGAFNLAARYMQADQRYQDLPSLFGDSRYRQQMTFSAGANLGRAGDLNLAYTLQAVADGVRTEALVVTYQRPLFHNRATFTISGYAEEPGADWGTVLTFSIPLGHRAHAVVQDSNQKGAKQQSLDIQGESADRRLEWALTAAQGNFHGASAEASWDGRHVDLYGRAVRVNGSNGIQGEVGQSFVFLDGRLHVADRIEDGFAVVEVEGSPGVEVNLENRPYGKTDAHGQILLNTLTPYVGNAISIDPLDLPIDAQPERIAAQVAPRQGAGAVVRFPVRRARAALVVLRRPDGSPVPVGAAVSLAGASRLALMGYDGETYVEGLTPGVNRLEVTWPEGRCTVRFEARAEAGRLDRLGPFTCAP